MFIYFPRSSQQCFGLPGRLLPGDKRPMLADVGKLFMLLFQHSGVSWFFFPLFTLLVQVSKKQQK